MALTIYKIIVSPLLHQLLGVSRGCRFNPSCSEYTIMMVEDHGIVKGMKRGLKRVLSCSQFSFA